MSTIANESPLAAARVAARLSRERLAHLAGISSRTIYAIEREGVRPQRSTVRVLAQALGCDVGDLVPAIDNDEAPARNAGASPQKGALNAPCPE